MGLVKTRRLATMQKQQRAKAGMRPPCKDWEMSSRSRSIRLVRKAVFQELPQGRLGATCGLIN